MIASSKLFIKLILITNVIKVFAELTIIIFDIILCSLSSKDPFKSHIIGNKTNYFNVFPQSSSIDVVILFNNITNENSTIKKNKLQRFLEIDSVIKDRMHLFKRRLTSKSFCLDLLNSFERNEGKKLSYIFELNYEVIRKLSITLTTINIVFIILTIFDVIRKIRVKYNVYDRAQILILQILNTIIEISKFVLSLLLYHFIEIGDIEKYDNFLECGIVKKEYFEQFSDINKLRKIFLGFGILNIVSESLDKVEDIFQNFEIFKQSNEIEY